MVFKLNILIRLLVISLQLIFLCLASSRVHALPVERLLEKADLMRLSEHSSWMALVHYRKDTFGGGFTSEADDERFFLSANGKYSPAEELLANIRTFFSSSEESREKQCQFPARYFWLKQQLKPDVVLNAECKETNKWLDELEPESVTLVFPASYVNSPSSMFGHTLLRINLAGDKSDNPLTGFSVSYAANVPANEIGFLFAYRGIFGGYEGNFSIVPYYEKIKEYNDIENRDIWEYGLNFTAEESKQVLRHVWELKDINFDYFFLTENCSYQLLTLLEIVRPELKLREQFNYKAVPADTVRSVVDAGIIVSAEYRPSGTTVLLERNAVISEHETEIIKALIETDKDITELTDPLGPESRSRVIEYAYDFFRYKSSDTPHLRDKNASRSYDLLRVRSEQPVAANWPQIPVPEVRNDEGHDTSRVAVGLGQENALEYLSVKIRPAYHDVMDPLPGYGFGAQINFLDLSLKYFSAAEKLELEKLTFINISSMTPVSRFISPVSWAADVALERRKVNSELHNLFSVKAGGGKSYLLADHNMISVIAEGALDYGNDLSKGYSLGAGLKAEWLITGSSVSSKLKLETIEYRAGEQYRDSVAEWELSVHISKNQGLRFKASREKLSELYENQYEIALHWYY
ncbi:MAG: DUF4105 domain-containing protein [Gammaproteobacteria bacterium]|nr:DUF4105 domain-containing protein [Gammaproteobacteria bacterium]